MSLCETLTGKSYRLSIRAGPIRPLTMLGRSVTTTTILLLLALVSTYNGKPR